MKKIFVAEPVLDGNEAKYVLDAITEEGHISSFGKYINKFEQKMAASFQRKFASSCSNGTTALHLALLALNVGLGDEVILPSMTFAACAAVVVHCGATPVFIDSNIDDWTLDINQLDSKLTPKTKAVIAVDLYGLPADYEYLEKWCKKNKVYLIEDAAEAHGARFMDSPVGSFGSVSCFSFYGNKVLTTGEGGICLTDDKEIHERIGIFKNHGTKPGINRSERYEHSVAGFNFRLTNLQAAVGCAQLERMNKFLSKRDKINAWYHKYLGGIKEITFQKFDSKKIKPVCWLFSCLVKKDVEKIMDELAGKGVESRPFFKPLHLQGPYKKYCAGQKFPVAEYLWKYGLTLPTSVKLEEKEIKYICDCLKKELK